MFSINITERPLFFNQRKHIASLCNIMSLVLFFVLLKDRIFQEVLLEEKNNVSCSLFVFVFPLFSFPLLFGITSWVLKPLLSFYQSLIQLFIIKYIIYRLSAY